MSYPPETRICPICHALLWEEDFLHPGDLETFDASDHPADGSPSEAQILALAELLLEIILHLEEAN